MNNSYISSSEKYKKFSSHSMNYNCYSSRNKEYSIYYILKYFWTISFTFPWKFLQKFSFLLQLPQCIVGEICAWVVATGTAHQLPHCIVGHFIECCHLIGQNWVKISKLIFLLKWKYQLHFHHKTLYFTIENVINDL